MCIRTLAGLSLLSLLVSAAILSPPPTPFLPITITHPQPNNSSPFPPPNVLRIQCDGARYGRNLNPNSCRDVFNFMAKSDSQTTFAERHTGRPDSLPLPWRVMSSDGLCFVQPLLLRGAVTGHVSSTQMAQSAYTLFQRCVLEKGIGGIAADIGGDNHINVVIADYAPNIRCDRSATPGPPWESCLAIVADMAATKARKVFGDKSRDPRVEVNLPFFFKAIDARCQASVEIAGKSTSATWYEIWEAMAALSTMCVRAYGKGGKGFGLGLRKNIFIQMSDENPDMSQPVANIGNVSAAAPLLGLETPNAVFEVDEPEGALDASLEAPTGLVQGSGSLLLIPSNASSDDSEDSLA